MHNKSLGESVVASKDAKPDHLEIVYTAQKVNRFQRQTSQYSTRDDRQFGVQTRASFDSKECSGQ
jgi:hypothetical protein